MQVTRLAVVMPAFNEAEGLPSFITELNETLGKWSPSFVVIDDCSTDETANVARLLVNSGIPIDVCTNESNSGHGPSTIRALKQGLAQRPDYILAVDGDGQFLGEDIRLIVETLEDSGAAIVEGVRTKRSDPPYRRLISVMTRILVASKTREFPADANTPLRAYRKEELTDLLEAIPNQAATPNLIISVLCRKWRLAIVEVPVLSIPRRGSHPGGSTWGNSRQCLPNKRLVRFCVDAARAWTVTSFPPCPQHHLHDE